MNPPGPSETLLASIPIQHIPPAVVYPAGEQRERFIFHLLFTTSPPVDSAFTMPYCTWKFCSLLNIPSFPFEKMFIAGTFAENLGGSTSGFVTAKLLGLFISFLAVLIANYLFQRKRGQLPLPPGPRGVPIFGNLFQIAPQYHWHQQKEWTQIYGPIFRIQLGALTVIVLGTHQAARDLLDKRWKIYSDRPEFIVCAKHLSGGTSLLAFVLAFSITTTPRMHHRC